MKSGLYELGIIHHTEVAEKAFFHHLHLDGLDHFSDLVEAADDPRETIVILYCGNCVPDLGALRCCPMSSCRR